jgi:hypothetical protein
MSAARAGCGVSVAAPGASSCSAGSSACVSSAALAARITLAFSSGESTAICSACCCEARTACVSSVRITVHSVLSVKKIL